MISTYFDKFLSALALATIAVGSTCTLAQPTDGQSYPSRSVTVIVPFPPGGGTDIGARLVSQKLSQKWGQSVVVENRGGAAGLLGADAVAKAKPDGYTVLMALSSLTVIPEADVVLSRPAMFALTDLRPIARFTADPTVLAVRAESPWKTVQQFVDDAKKLFLMEGQSY